MKGYTTNLVQGSHNCNYKSHNLLFTGLKAIAVPVIESQLGSFPK